jgi:GPH family glycoside/pentoside/hexuronide:cation symporter
MKGELEIKQDKFNVNKPSKKRIIGYLVGVIPTTLIIGFFGVVYVNFFYDDLQIKSQFWILGLGIYAFINAVNEPLIGQLLDKTDVEKWGGRRIPYIKYFTPLLCISFVLLWFPWSETNQIIMFIHFTVMICIYETFLNIIVVAWMTLLPDMTTDPGLRAKIGFFSSIITLFCGLCLFPVVYILNNRNIIQILSIIIAIISGVCYMITAKFSKETPENQFGKIPPLIQSIKKTLKRKSFIGYMGFRFGYLLETSIGISYAFIYVLVFGEQNIIFYLIFGILIGYISSILCIRMRKKYGIKRIMVIFLSLKIVGGILTFFIIINPRYEWFLWIGLTWNSFFGGAVVFDLALQGHPIDEDELDYGARREAMFIGVNSLFTIQANSIGPIIATLILNATFYIADSPLAAQPESAIVGIKSLLFLIPQIFSFIELIFIIFYPMKKLESIEFQEKIRLYHTQKRKKLNLRNNRNN